MRKKQDIQNLLAVLGVSIFCAALLAFVFIYYHGPSGRYVAGHTILEPAIIQQINDQEFDSKGQKARFVFDHFEFSYFDAKTKQVRKVPVSFESYQKLYQLIAQDLSLEDKDGTLNALFMHSHPTLLTTAMRTLNASSSSNTRIFQVIEFIKENYFRVQLQEKHEHGDWVYFYSPNSYQEVMQLFNKDPSAV